MKLTNIGIEIAKRELVISGGKAVTVLIGMPQRFPDGNDDYYCPFKIIGISNDSVRYAGGIDAIQALLLAFQMIGSILYTSQEAKSGNLSWNGVVDLGFPVPDSLQDLPPKK